MGCIIHYGIRKKHKVIKRDEIAICADSSGKPGYIGRWYDVFYSRAPLESEIYWKEGSNRVICRYPYYLDKFNDMQDLLDAIIDDDRLSEVPEPQIRALYNAFCEKFGRHFTFLEPGHIWHGNINRVLMGELLKNKMKATNNFQQTIKAYLDDRASKDTLFAVSYGKAGKNINDCVTYILNTVQKSGKNGFTDDEIYSMAVHYYDENNIKAGKEISGRVVVNHTVEQTGKAVIQSAKTKVAETHKPKPARKNDKSDVQQLSLFD